MQTETAVSAPASLNRRERPEPLAYSVNEVIEIAHSCRTIIYREMKSGRLKFIKVGARTLILREDLLAWLQSYRTEKLGPAHNPRPFVKKADEPAAEAA